jgi:ferrochelatase
MAYGTPGGADEVEAYYTHIRRGRRPSTEELDELMARYDAIGGVSPLASRTEAQRAAIERALGGAAVVGLGNKHAAPFVEDAVADLASRGSERIVGLVLAPHYSRASVGEYHERGAKAASEAGLTYTGIDSWCDDPAWLDFQAAAVRDALAVMPAPTVVLFTAHSLPERVLIDDSYAEQLGSSAAEIAARAGLAEGRWRVAWQSAGRTPEPWRGPDVRETIAEIGTDGVTRGVVVCPQGFTADHLEVLYDLDIDARDVATRAGLDFARTRSVNDDAAVMAALAERVLDELRA